MVWAVNHRTQRAGWEPPLLRGTLCLQIRCEPHPESVLRPEQPVAPQSASSSQGPEGWELEMQKQDEGSVTAPGGLGS